MAGKMDSLQESLSCPVCFEDFEENGIRVPRLLPCSHTLCHTCIGQLIRNNRLECPTCRMKHEARNKEINFPQNKYILTMMRRRQRLEGEEIDEWQKCPKHGENEILFCREDECQKMICPLCLSEAHLGHKVVAVKVQTKDVLAKLLKSIEITSERLNKNIGNVTDVSQDIIKKTEANFVQVKKEKDKRLQDLERKKEEMTKQYDEIIKQVEDEKNKLSETSGNELKAMRDSITFLTDIKESIEEEENTYEDALKKLETVNGVIENVQHMTNVKKYKYSEYVAGEENLVGKLVKKEKFALLHVPAPELQGQGQYTAIEYCFI